MAIKKKINITEVREIIAKKEQEVRCLEGNLTSVSSDIGDWKIIKCMEYQAMGINAPYDINELNEKRQAVRNKINILQEEITELQKQVDEADGE